jgi:2-dehydropantoate 2-reductase
MAKAKHIAIVGGGAVGCFYAGMLSRSGFRVTLIARPSRCHDINKNGGLFLDCGKLGFQSKITLFKTSDDYSTVRNNDFVFLSVKSMDTESTVKQIAPFLSNKTPVIR